MIVPTPRSIRLLQAIFILSGACGLIYESVWAHYLKLFLGHAAYAQTVVLVVFIGGMAIGAAACGRYAQRITNPLRAYAAVELAIGVGGIAFHRVFIGATDWAYATLLPMTCGTEGSCVSSWLLAAALVLPQSVMLGATFPLLVSGVMRATGTDAGRHVSLLYFLNSIGAVAGVLAATFIAIPAIGLPGTTLSAGIGNVFIAIIVWEVARYVPKAVPKHAGPADEPSGYGSTAAIRLLLAVSALTGLSSFLYEIFWIRMLSLVLGASTHAFELMLASFILGLALGGWWIRSRIDRIADAWRFLGRVQVLMGLAAVATLPLYSYSFEFMAQALKALARTEQGYVLYNLLSAGIAMVVMLPATFLAGMTLPLITLLLLRTKMGERSIGFVYSANTAGAIGGVILAVHLLMPLVGLRPGMLIAGAIDIVLGYVLLVRSRGITPLQQGDWAAAGLGAVVFVAIALGPSFDPNMLASGVFRDGRAKLPTGSEVIFHADGKTATVDVVKTLEGEVFIRTNGKTDAGAYVPAKPGKTGDEETMVLAGTLPHVYRPDAKQIAIIGFGSGMTTATVLDSARPLQVETIEIEPAMIEGARAFMPIVEGAYKDPRSRFIIDDAKAHFARAGRKYDVIISEPSNPWVSGVASLFTREFYERVHGQLNDGGLLVQWVQVYEFNLELLVSVLRPLGEVFDDYVAYYAGGSDLVIVASAKGMLGEPSSALFGEPKLAKRLAQMGIRSIADIELHRVSGRNPIDQFISDIKVDPNSDYFPVVDQGASRARFMRTTAKELFELVDAPVPLVEMLEKRLPKYDAAFDTLGTNQRQDRAVTAQKLAAYLAAARPTDGKATDRGTVLEESVAITRAILVDCAPVEVAVPLWDRVVLTAAEMNPVLPPAQAEGMWRSLARRECLSRLSSDKTTWVELFAAVGARDATRMAQLAATLLDRSDTTETQRIYLFNALITGQLAERQFAAARMTWGRMEKELPASTLKRPWMQLQRKWARDPF